MRDDDPPLTPDLLMQAYRAGVFPMSESRDDPQVFWVDPRQRGILPIADFHISRSLGKFLRKTTFRVTADADFRQVVLGCANRETTWINDTIFDLYMALHLRGDAHSVEVWDDNTLVGGVYGVTIGSAFFGESMFSTATNASKTALACLTSHLQGRGFTLFDTQFITDHLSSLGAVEIPRDSYHDLLDMALITQADFGTAGPIAQPYDVVQRKTQTS